MYQLSAGGVPTVNGFFDLLEGTQTAELGYGTTRYVDSELDDFLSLFRQYGYRSQMFFPTPPNFDGQAQFMFRGQYNNTFMRQLDDFYFYFPTP